jgi:hypothetical protein
MTIFNSFLILVGCFALLMSVLWLIGQNLAYNEIDRQLNEIETLIEKTNPDEPAPLRKALDDMDTSKLNTEQSRRWQLLWVKYYKKFPAQKIIKS